MKRGQSYICLNSKDNATHPIIKALINNGWDDIEIVYATHYSTDAGWTLLTAGRNGKGFSTWLGFTKQESIKNINTWESLKSI